MSNDNDWQVFGDWPNELQSLVLNVEDDIVRLLAGTHTRHAIADSLRSAVQPARRLMESITYGQHDGWIPHDGTVINERHEGRRTVREHAGCPVPPGTGITVRFRDGTTLETASPESMRWGWTRQYGGGRVPSDIVAWRVT